MKRMIAACLAASLLLSGCGASGSYVSIVPHSERTEVTQVGSVPAENEEQLLSQLHTMIASGNTSGVIYTVKMDAAELERIMPEIIFQIRNTDSIGAFALDDVSYEIGTTGGKTAVAVSASYRRGSADLKKMLRLMNMTQVSKAIRDALDSCKSGVVMYVREYEETDFVQLVQDIARQNLQTVMEIPEITEAVYGTDRDRVIELQFSYETSRERLRQMQTQVAPVFDSAALYVSGEGSDHQKLSQLYAFLMERFDYAVETSITPTYSLLHHGVGDSRAFASVYAAMCERAGLECLVVTGARNGEPWTWNIVRDGEGYYHVDLLASNAQGYLRECRDAEMNGYVWDYSAFPICEP